MEATASGANVIPVSKFNENDEKAEREKWLNLALAENSKLPADKKVWPNDVKSQDIKIQYRYIRLQVEKYVDPKGQSNDFLVGYEGQSMMYKKELSDIERGVISQ